MQATEGAPRLTTLDAAAEQLGVGVNTLRVWRWKRQHLDFVRVGGRLMILQHSVDRLIKRGTVPALEQEGQ